MSRGPRHGWGHRKARAWWALRTTPGVTPCAYCHQPVGPDWHLAHDDDNPGRYLGPAHPRCNQSRQRESPAAKGKPHNWSRAYKITKVKLSRLEQRERERLERMRRRTIIVPRDEQDQDP